MITQEEVKELLDYNPDTGVFTWKVRRGGSVSVGDIAGTLHHTSYLLIGIKGKIYSAHRLAWLYMTGNWPKQDIDHINGNRVDNRFDNLRDVSSRENSSNTYKHRNGKLVGCSYHRCHKKWMAQIVINGENIGLGFFPTEQEAHQAYLTAKGNL
jgi:hypothetical protein